MILWPRAQKLTLRDPAAKRDEHRELGGAGVTSVATPGPQSASNVAPQVPEIADIQPI